MPLPLNTPTFLPQSLGPKSVGPIFFAGSQHWARLTFSPTQVVSASVSFTGQKNQQTTNPLLGSLSFVGQLSRSTIHRILGNLSFVGQITRSITRLLLGSLSFIGGLSKITVNIISFLAALSFTGSLSIVRAFRRILTAAISFVGQAPTHTTRMKQLLGQLTLSGFLPPGSFGIVFSATLSFAGRIRKLTTRKLSANTILAGQASKRMRAFVTGHVRSSGRLNKRSGQGLTGSLTFVGRVRRTAIKHFISAGSFVGSFKRIPGKGLRGTLMPSGQISRRTSHLMTGVLHIHGTIKRYITRRLATASLNLVGRTTKVSQRRFFSGVLGFVGAFVKHRGLLNVKPTASLSFSVRFEALGAVDTIYQPDPDTYLGLYPDEILMVMPDLQFQLVEAPSRDGVLQPNDPWRTK